MKALRWHARGAVQLDDVPTPPPPPPGEVQLRVLWCGICGTDVEEWRHGPLNIPAGLPHPLTGAVAPLTLGHEVSGEVTDVGAGVDGLRLGDRVAVDGVVFCTVCRECTRHRVNLCRHGGQVGFARDGGLQEVVNVPAQVCLPLPASVAAEGGAIAETLSVGVRALRRAALVPGERVAVFGAGAVGLLALQVARASGAGFITVVDPLASRRALAVDLGADEVMAPDAAALPGEEPRPDTAGQIGADVVLECSGHPAGIIQAIAAARSSGRVMLVGITTLSPPIPILDLIMEEKSLIGSAGHVWDEDFAAALRLLAAGAVTYEPLLTRIGLDDALESGLLALANHPERHVKILVSPRS
jgi:(R,R)-butanediol dehydrogenase / meso-butanediol dehydrogenase / diacetyl reductase